MYPTGFIPDETYPDHGTYQYEDGSSQFGQRDPELDAMVQERAQSSQLAPTLEDPTPAAVEGVPIEGTDGLVLSSQPTIFSEPAPDDGQPMQSREQSQAAGSPLAEMNQRHGDELRAAEAELERETMLAKEREIEAARLEGMAELERQKAAEQHQRDLMKEQQQKVARLHDERKAVEETKLETEFTTGNGFKDFLMVIAAGLGGAIGSDRAIGIMQKDIDSSIQRQLKTKGSKLDQLADRLGSEEKAMLAARDAALKAAEAQVEARGKIKLNQQEAKNLPLMKAQLRAARVKAIQEFDKKSMAEEIGFANDQAELGLKERGAELDQAKFGHQRAIDWARLAQDKRATGSEPLAPTEHAGAQAEAAKKRNELAIAFPGMKPAEREKMFSQFEEKYRPDAIAVTGYDALTNALDAARDGGDVSGFGRFARTLPSEWTGDKGVNLRQEFGAAMSSYMKEMSGAAVNEAEFDRMRETIENAGDYAEMRKGVELLGRKARARLEAMRGGSNQILARISDSAIERSRANSKAVLDAIASQKKATSAVRPRKPTVEEPPTPTNLRQRLGAPTGGGRY